MLLVWLALYTAAGWLAAKDHRQRRAVARLQQLGVSVQHYYDCHPRSGWRSSPILWTWLRGTMLGEGTVWDVSFYPAHAKVHGDRLDCLKEFAELGSLCLSGIQNADTGITHLKSLTGLRRLILIDTDVSDNGLALLPRFRNLNHLQLNNTGITDAGLEHLGLLHSLTSLDLDATLVTDAGLKHLHQLKNLEILCLTGTQVSTDGIEQLQRALPMCTVYYQSPNKARPQSKSRHK